MSAKDGAHAGLVKAMAKAAISAADAPGAAKDEAPAASAGLIPAHRGDAEQRAQEAAERKQQQQAQQAQAQQAQPPQQQPPVKLLARAPTVPPAMARDEWRTSDYTILEKIYTGYASKVYRAVCRRSRETVVLKAYALPSICHLYQHQIFREVGLHARLLHENVVQLHAAFQVCD
jgi:hypothetical protein